jgi:GNAT superfamily N-acetyltransferase
MTDVEALARVHVRGWQAAYEGLMPQEYLDGLDPEQRAQTWQRWLESSEPPRATLVLEDGLDGVVGFVGVAASRDPGVDPLVVGEVAAIYLLPSHWRRGGGRMLMQDATRLLMVSGMREATLWVLESNERARAFYESVGWAADGERKVDDSLGFPMEEVRYRRGLRGGR